VNSITGPDEDPAGVNLVVAMRTLGIKKETFESWLQTIFRALNAFVP